MKKLTLAIAAASLLSSAAFAQNMATGKVDFLGEVTTAPCVVSVADSVKLGSYTVKSLAGADAAGEWGYQDINLHNCDLDPGNTGSPEFTSVMIEIDAGSASTVPAIWKNMGTAGNVGIEIEVQGKPVTPAGNIGSSNIEAKLSAAGAKVTVAGRTKKLNDQEATPGIVKTSINFVATFQ